MNRFPVLFCAGFFCRGGVAYKEEGGRTLLNVCGVCRRVPSSSILSLLEESASHLESKLVHQVSQLQFNLMLMVVACVDLGSHFTICSRAKFYQALMPLVGSHKKIKFMRYGSDA